MYSGLFLVFLFTTRIKGLHVQGSSSPLETQLGASLLLPCFTQNPLSLEGLQVEWRKTESDSLVNIFQQGESKSQLQSEAFRGRVHFFPDEISKGNFSILLQNVVKNDTGVYRCKVSKIHSSGETLVEIRDAEHLVVTGSDLALSVSVGDEVVLNCSVGSNVPIHEIEEVTWKRTDRDVLILLYQDNEIHSDSTHESYQGRAEFFVKEIPKGNFSLKLKDIQIEDKGEYTCEVHTSQRSGHAVVILQRLGFSTLHIFILVLCLVVLLLTVGLGVPVFILLIKKDASGKLMWMDTFLILCPNICMCVAFILWLIEGFPKEVLICTAVSIIRPLVLLKTFPELKRFPKLLAKAVKSLSFPIYHSVLTTAICTSTLYGVSWDTVSKIFIVNVTAGLTATVICFTCAVILAGFFLQIQSTLCLELTNAGVLCLLAVYYSDTFDRRVNLVAAWAPPFMGSLLVLSIQRHYFQGKPFQCVNLTLSSVIATLFSLSQIAIYIQASSEISNFARAWILLFEGLMFIIAWIFVVLLLRCQKCSNQRCTSQHREFGYLCCALINTCLMIACGAVCLQYLNTNFKIKDRAGLMALTAQIHLLAAVSHFKHPRNLPYLPQTVLYMFGATGLNVVNSITLATELSLKSAKGERTIQDLSLISISFEIVFLSGWLALIVFELWTRTRYKMKQNVQDEKEEEPQVLQEMEALSDSVSKS